MKKWFSIGSFLALAFWGCGDGGSSSGSNIQNSAILSWDPNTEEDLAGYWVYYGTASDDYTTVLDAGLTDTPEAPEYTVTDLEIGVRYYFALTAYDFSGNESDFSDEAKNQISDL